MSARQDIMPCLKRAPWIVNLRHAVYQRKAGVNEDPISVVQHDPDASDFIPEEGKVVLKQMREDEQMILLEIGWKSASGLKTC